MAGTLKTSQFNSASVANPTDEVPLLQGGQLKRVQVKVLTGNPDVGYQASGESWVYSSWSSTTRIGVVTVPSDATTKYTKGMRVRIAQATGGTKYAIIMDITTTTLVLFFPTGTTLNNEAITSSFYSPLYAPVGFPTDPDLWTLKASLAANSSVSSPAAATWYNALSLVVGQGKWLMDYEATEWIVKGSAPVCWGYVTLSTESNTNSDPEMGGMCYSANTTEQMATVKRQKVMTFAAQQTMYLNYAINQSGNTSVAIYSSTEAQTISVIRARCAYI